MLSIRLKAIYDLIEKESKVADIGTDHGNLLYELAKNEVISYGIGVENKIGPYNVAKENLQYFIDTGKLSLSLSDGLNEVPSNVDTVIIAGMGGELISKIIFDNLDKARCFHKLILQPNSKIYDLRKKLSENHFDVFDELIVYDNHKFYEIISVKYNPNSLKLSTKELIFGPKLLSHKTPVFVDKWQKKINEINTILGKNSINIDNLKELQKLIMEVLDE